MKFAVLCFVDMTVLVLDHHRHYFHGCRTVSEPLAYHVGAFQLKNIRGSRSFSDSGRGKQ